MTKTSLICSVSCFNLGCLEQCLGDEAQQSSPVATELGYCSCYWCIASFVVNHACCGCDWKSRTCFNTC